MSTVDFPPCTLAHALSAEERRLGLLRQLQVLDSAPEAIFDTLAETASELCGTPIALLSLIDADRQWFKANVGLTGTTETPREVAFCDHAIRQGGLFEVPDASRDARFADNPLVTRDPRIRFYAGAPLVMAGGERIGTLCVIDREERRLSPQQSRLLLHLARVAVQALELRRGLVGQCLAVSDAHLRGAAESEHWLRSILDTQAELVAQAAPDGTLLYANPAYAGLFRKTAAAITGTSLYDYVDPADREIVHDRIQWVLQTGETLRGENRMQSPGGDECWIAWTNTRQVAADGSVRLHSTGRDITARRRAERELRESKALLARTGRVARVGGWAMDLATRAVTWTDETRRLHEVGPDFRPSLERAIAFYAPASRPLIEQAVQRALESGEGWDLQLELITAKGRRILARAVGEVESEDGRPVRLVGAFQDVTEQQRLQEAVAGSERFLRQLTDSLPIRIAYLDRERRYRFVNREWCRLTGIDRSHALGRTRAELFPQRDEPELARRALAALEGQAQRFEFDETIFGAPRRFENRLTPDIDPSGRVSGFFVTGIDISERSAAERALRRVAAIFDNCTDYVVQADRWGHLLYLNPAARGALGLAPGAPVDGLRLQRFMPGAARRLYRREIRGALQRGTVWVGQTAVRIAPGTEVPVSLMVIAHHDAAGRVERYSALMRDISAQLATQQEAVRQATTLRSVADTIPAMVAVVDRSGRYRFVNPAFAAAVRRPRAEIVGALAREVLGESEFAQRRPWIDRALAGEPASFEIEQPGGEGRAHLAMDYIPLRLPDGSVDGFVAIGQDVTRRKHEEARLRRLSQTDPLTGLLNRSGFDERVDGMLGDGADGHVAILYVDLDRFKPVNDRHGHAAGDELLRQLARRLTRLVRPSDAVARLGGDEFAILLPGMRDVEQAGRVARQIVEAAGTPFQLGGIGEVTIGASVGGALGTAARRDWQHLLATADRLLYRAKHDGRGRAIVERAAPAA